MSYTEIYIFKKDGNAEKFGEVRNAWRGVVAVWKILEKKYLPPHEDYLSSLMKKPEGEYLRKKYPDHIPTRTSGSEKDCHEIWDLYKDERLTLNERMILFSTFDKALVKKEDLPALITAYESFEGETSLPEQAEMLKKIYLLNDVIAVGWNQNSANADTWEYYSYDEDTEEDIPYNCLTGTDHFWVPNNWETEK